MAEKKVKYFNMIIHLIRNNRLYEENVAIRNIWEKDKNNPPGRCKSGRGFFLLLFKNGRAGVSR